MPSSGRRHEQQYLFASLGSKEPDSSRKVHIRRLTDVLYVCIHRRDWSRARSAWLILARCPEFDWKNLWQTGLLLCTGDNMGFPSDESHNDKPIEYIRVVMLRSPPQERIRILEELVLWLIKQNRYRDALEELELYLPSFPYHDAPTLHVYAGLLCFFLAHPQSRSEVQNLNLPYLRESRTYLKRAAELEPSNPVASGLLKKLEGLLESSRDADYDTEVEQTEDRELLNRPAKKPHQ